MPAVAIRMKFELVDWIDCQIHLAKDRFAAYMCSYLSTFAFDGLSKAVNYEKPISIFYRKE